jgi:hypothetical protein
MECVTLPSGLHTLTFGYSFNHRQQGVAVTCLKIWIFGDDFSQSLDGVVLPRRLRILLRMVCQLSFWTRALS